MSHHRFASKLSEHGLALRRGGLRTLQINVGRRCNQKFASRALVAVSELLHEVRPDLVLVQGDTTTVMMAALAAFYQRISVGHVEAGLRTRNWYSPFPEEINRRMAGVLSTFTLPQQSRRPTPCALSKIPEEDIFITGNTVVDALLMTVRRPVNLELDFNMDGRRLILVTAHRRESFGTPFESICLALRELAERNPDVEIVYPVHPHPNVRGPVRCILDGQPRIHLQEPVRYEQFVHL